MRPLEPRAERWFVRARLVLAFAAIAIVAYAFAFTDWENANLWIRLAVVALAVSQMIPDLISQFTPSGLQARVLQRVEAACHEWRNYYLVILGDDRVETDADSTWEDLQQQPVVPDGQQEYERYRRLFEDGIPRTVRRLDSIVTAYSDQLPARLRTKILATATQLEVEATGMNRGYALMVPLAHHVEGFITFRVREVLKLLANLCREAERLRAQAE